MKPKLLLLSLVAFAAISLKAQQSANVPALEFKDFSFEHPVGNGVPLQDWYNCNGSADIQPIMIAGTEVGVRVPPKPGNGNSYLAMVCNKDKLVSVDYYWQEAICQLLIKPMKKGVRYTLLIDIMVPKNRWEFDQYGPPRNQVAKQHIISGDSNTLARRRSKPGAIAIRGANTTINCTSANVLWRSKTVQNNNEWVTEEFTITPDADYTYFIITPEIPDEVTNTKDATGSAEIVDYVCIDNIRSYIDSTSSKVKPIISLNNSDAAGFTLYPNPTKDLFYLTFSKPTKGAIIEVYNSVGDLVHKQNIVNPTTTLELTGYREGLYFVKVIGDFINATQKVVKQ